MRETTANLVSGVAATEVRPATARGGRQRVVIVHDQARRGLGVAVGFLVAATVTGVVRAGTGWWLPLHLFAVGALLSAVSAFTQMLAVTWSGAPAPRPAVVRSQRWCLAAGTITLVTGHEIEVTWLFVAGGFAVVAAMVALVPILLQVRRHSVTGRFAPAIEAYVGAVLAGAVGMSLGLVLGAGWARGRAFELRGTHLILNLFGLVGLVIAGTLPYFAATQVRTKMSRRATATAMRVTFAGLMLATAAGALGRVIDRPGLVALGLIAYAAGLLIVVALLPVFGRRQLVWAGPRLVQLLAGIAWWAAMALGLARAAIRPSDDRLILRALVIGGFAQILVSSFAYLGPVLRGGGHERLTAGFRITRSWVSLLAANAAAFATLAGRGTVARVALTVWLVDVATRATLLLTTTRRRVHV